MSKKVLLIVILLVLVTTALFAGDVTNIDGLGDPTAPFEKLLNFLRGKWVRIFGGLALFALGVSALIEGTWTNHHKKGILTTVSVLGLILGGPAIIDWLSSDFETQGALVKEGIKMLYPGSF